MFLLVLKYATHVYWLIDESDVVIIPIFTTQKKEETIFKLAKASHREVMVTCFLKSCTNTIKNCFDYISPGVSFLFPLYTLDLSPLIF
jgi:hypothetical protein